MQNNNKLGYTRYGNEQGLPLCLIHGWGLDSSFLLPIAQMFPERDIYLIDLPGYGQSYAQSALSGDFNATVEALAHTLVPYADVMAVSMGALYVLRALSHKDTPPLSSLITICSNARFPGDPNWPGFGSELIYKCRTLLTPQRCKRLLHLFIKLQDLKISDKSKPHPTSADFLQQALEQCRLPSYETLMHGINIASYVDVRADLENLDLPCLQLFGAKDRLVPAALTYALQSAELRSSYIFVNSAHNPYLTEPVLFERVVREFYDKVQSFYAGH